MASPDEGNGVKVEPPEGSVVLPDEISEGTSAPPADLEIKQEYIKQEHGHETVVNHRPEYVYKCRICEEIFNSRYEFAVHVSKHEIRCVNCKAVYETWRDLEAHEDFCPRRYGRFLIPPREKRPPKKKKLPFSCQLCRRRYQTFRHLYNHQVNRCKKRYISSNWVVKI